MDDKSKILYQYGEHWCMSYLHLSVILYNRVSGSIVLVSTGLPGSTPTTDTLVGQQDPRHAGVPVLALERHYLQGVEKGSEVLGKSFRIYVINSTIAVMLNPLLF